MAEESCDAWIIWLSSPNRSRSKTRYTSCNDTDLGSPNRPWELRPGDISNRPSKNASNSSQVGLHVRSTPSARAARDLDPHRASKGFFRREAPAEWVPHSCAAHSPRIWGHADRSVVGGWVGGLGGWAGGLGGCANTLRHDPHPTLPAFRHPSAASCNRQHARGGFARVRKRHAAHAHLARSSAHKASRARDRKASWQSSAHFRNTPTSSLVVGLPEVHSLCFLG